jgi:hypothetical protein
MKRLLYCTPKDYPLKIFATNCTEQLRKNLNSKISEKISFLTNCIFKQCLGMGILSEASAPEGWQGARPE